MSNTDSEDLKTDEEDSPPPDTRTRGSMDETDAIVQLQMENNQLQKLLLHERKSSILNIHKMNALENELNVFKNKLEAEKYESEANKAIIAQLEQQLFMPNASSNSNINIQNEPQNTLIMQSTQYTQQKNPASPQPLQQQNSASPRPPPTQPPPPVPPTKPTQKEINNASNNILLNLDDLEKKTNSYSRGRNRRRRASLPSMNILPSFKSLKHAMGFGSDDNEDDKTNENDNESDINNNNNNRDKNGNINYDKKNDDLELDKDPYDLNLINNKIGSGSGQNHDKINDKKNHIQLNKKLNPKEIKQLYIKNLKLQAQLDKMKEKEKEYQRKISDSAEQVEELTNQLKLKTQVLKQLDDQVSEKEDTKKKELERLLVEKDTTIQALRQEMLKIQTNAANLIPNTPYRHNGNLSPSPTTQPTQDNNLPRSDAHKRTLTPGGYQLDSLPWVLAQQNSPKETDDAKVDPSAPPMEDIHTGMSLDQKLKQRPDWKDLHGRGILLDDPTSKKSESLNQASRHLHKRRKSIQIEKMLINRPKPQELQDKNVLKDLPPEVLGNATPHKNTQNGKIMPLDIRVDNGIDLDTKLQQRPSWLELNQRGILFDDPTTKKSHSLQAAQRQLHKRKASQNLEKMLFNRPTPDDLTSHNIIDASTAQLFFGASPITQVVTPSTDGSNDALTTMLNEMDIDDIERSSDALYRASTSFNGDVIYKDKIINDRENLQQKMERKLRQRPSIDETFARGILIHRPDTKLNYDLQARHKQLHKRKASQKLEKLMFKRPDPKSLEKKGILLPTKDDKEKQRDHRRKKSQDLEAALKKRMSLSQMQGLGLLFQPHGIEFDLDPDNSSDEDHEHFMTDEEQSVNIAGLFKQKPRTSKPLQETDFTGVEFDDDGLNINNNVENKRRDSTELNIERDDELKDILEENEDDINRENGVGDSDGFEPFKLSKPERISRIGQRLEQRPTVEEMKMRGLLFDHPSTSGKLVERKRNLMKRRASNKVKSLLESRPKRVELENRNILLKEDETLDKRKRHKRKRSQNLENAIQRRPPMMKEDEAQRQRKRSMNDHDFKPDYLQHILNDEEEEDYQRELQQVDIRFLNVGGYVIPLVSPKFMSDLMGGGDDDGINDSKQIDDLHEKIEGLEEKVDELELKLRQKKASIKQKDKDILRLKGENSNLKQKSSRQSLIDLSNSIGPDLVNSIGNNQTAINEKNELERLRKEIETNNQYIDKLKFFMKENNNIDIPTPKQLKKQMKSKLNTRFKQRPSFMDLQRKAILTENFITDVTNQEKQIAEKKLKFRRTSDLIETFLNKRPSRERLLETNKNLFQPSDYLADAADYDNYMNGHRDHHTYVELEDTATKEELRQEVVRLNAMLAEKVHHNNKLEKENETMRFKIQENLNNDTQTLGRGLKEHSIYETHILNQAFVDLSKESDENKINELEAENHKKSEQIEKLQQKIRRLSTVDLDEHQQQQQQQNSMYNINNNNINEMKRFVDWSRKLSWPDIIKQLYQSDNDNYYLLMQRILMEEKRISKQEYNKLKEEGDKQRREYLFEIDELKKRLSETKRKHKSSMHQLPNPFTSDNAEVAQHILQDPSAHKIIILEKKLEKQKKGTFKR